MSTDFSIRPVGTPAATPVVQPSTDAAHKAVATELPASKTVTAADGSVSLRNDQRKPLTSVMVNSNFFLSGYVPF